MNHPMSPSRQLALRLFSFIVGAAAFGSGSILFFYRFTLQATLADQQVITSTGLKISGVGLFFYLLVIYLLVRPLLDFSRRAGAGGTFDDRELETVQDQALRLAPYMCLLGAAFYIAITPVNLAVGLHKLGWPLSNAWYGVFAGLIAAMLLIPVAFNLASWAVQPLLDLTGRMAKDLPPARRSGIHIDLRAKLLITFLPLTGAALLFTSLIGYSQNQAVLDNLAAMQSAFVSEQERPLLIDHIEHRLDPGVRSAEFYSRKMGNLRVFYGALITGALFIGLFLVLVAASEMTRPIKKLSLAVSRINSGAADELVRLVGNDELSDLAASFNDMTSTIATQVSAMKSVLANLRSGVKQLEGMVETILAVSVDQSSGASQQTTAVAEVSSVAEQMLASSRQIAERAGQLDEIASSTLAACRDGEGRLGEAGVIFEQIVKQSDLTLGAMSRLESSFKQTYKIVELIEEIASQTELLALNAELEAAGAGESGRRFAVVAQAIHELATRAGLSVIDIRALIESIHHASVENTRIARSGKEQVAQGEAAIGEVSSALDKISTLAENASGLVRGITLSTDQQSRASEELTGSVSEIHQIARVVEDGARKIEGSIDGLKGLAQELVAGAQSRLGAG